MPDGWGPRPPWRAYARDGLLAVLGVGGLGLLIVAVFFPSVWPFRSGFASVPPAWMTTARPSPSAPAPTPALAPPLTIRPEPEAVVLGVTDLAPGYHVLKAGPAVFSATAGRTPLAGWDVVFAPDAGRPTRYLLVESVVAVYADADTAVAAVETADAAEQGANAVRQAPIPGLASRQAVWIEPAPDRPGYGIVRVTWQTENVVGQVGALGPIGAFEPQQTAQLAMLERDRISVANS